jgi:septum formation protein
LSRIILASSSTIRARLLANAGIEFEQISPEVDEEKLRRANADLPPPNLAMALAREKAAAVSRQIADALVIGADQILLCGDEILSKPATLADARHQLEKLAGRTHQLETAVAGCKAGRVAWSAQRTALMTMRRFSTDFLDTYLEAIGDDALTSVGAYKFEGLGSQLFERVEGDYFAILGLPLLEVLEFLRAEGALAS